MNNFDIADPALAADRDRPHDHVDTCLLADDRRIHLLAEGRLVNLAAAGGHPAAVMDMSFVSHVLAAVYLANRERWLANAGHPVLPETCSEWRT